MSCITLASSAADAQVLAGADSTEVEKRVRAVVRHCKPEELTDQQLSALIEVAESNRVPGLRVQNFDSFMQRKFPPKIALVEGVLHKRDIISLTGRRRHGKTTLLSNLAAAGASGRGEYLGYRIPLPFTSVFFYLEDDGGEIQNKMANIRKEVQISPTRFHLYIRQDFYEAKIPIDAANVKFRQVVLARVEAAKQESGSVDLIVFDNLGMLIGADYLNAKAIHALMDFSWMLTQNYDAAVLIAAHPKKGNKLDAGGNPISLRNDPEKFFEEAMGSSHFINSTGSLWGIERDRKNGRTDILLGAQRAADTESFTLVEKNDNDWLEQVDDQAVALETVVNTKPRKQAWDLLPDDRSFSYLEAKQLVKPAMKSSGSFNPWFSDLRRVKLILEMPENGQVRYRKAKAGVTGQLKSRQVGGAATAQPNHLWTSFSPTWTPEHRERHEADPQIRIWFISRFVFRGENRRPSRPRLKTNHFIPTYLADPSRPIPTQGLGRLGRLRSAPGRNGWRPNEV
jgi:hypothetical protein